MLFGKGESALAAFPPGRLAGGSNVLGRRGRAPNLSLFLAPPTTTAPDSSRIRHYPTLVAAVRALP